MTFQQEPVRVLLVEDNPGDADLVREALSEAGPGRFVLRHVERLEEATRWLREEQTDAVLLDLSLPDGHGLATLAAVRVFAPDLPIVVLTGNTDEMLALKAVREGAQDYLVKEQIHGTLLVRALFYAIERKRSADALHATEARYRDIFERSRDGHFVSTIDGRLVEANLATAEIFGYDREELLTLRVQALYADPAERRLLQERIAEAGAIDEIELQGRRKDGSRIIVVLSATLWRDPDGRVLGYQGSVRDVTERRRAEAALQASEERFQLAAEATGDVLWDHDFRTDRLWWSEHFSRRFGYAPEEVGSTFASWEERVHPEDRARASESIEGALRARQPTASAEYRFRRADGDYLHVLDRMHFLYDEDGNPRRAVGALIDITERKRAEEALRDSQERTRAYLSRTPAVLWAVDCELRITFSEGGALAGLGLRPGELVGRSLYQAVGADEPENASIASHLSAIRGESVGYENVWQGRAFQVRVEPIYSPEGEIIGASGVAVDITARKRTEAALEEATDRLRTVLRLSPLPIVVLGEDHRVELWNRAAERTFGWTEKEVVGGAYPLLAEDGSRAEIDAILDDALEGQLESGREVRRRRKDGSVATLRIWNALLPAGSDGRRSLVGVLEDVSERRQLEEQLRQSQKMEAVGRLAGGIAHDFNNLLTVIGGQVQMTLEDLPASDPLRGELLEVSGAVERAASLTHQLLAFSRKQVLQPRPLDINTVVTDLERMLRRTIGEHIELATPLEPGVATVFADRSQMEQVLVNLAVNARDAMPAGGKLNIETASCVVERAEQPAATLLPAGSYTVLTVSDTGEGIEENVLPHIFDPFFTTKEQGKGTGLGLSTVYGIVKQSGGEITVASERGRGTRFKIYLPVSGEPAAEPAPTPATMTDQYGGETILLVEDETPVRTLTRRILEKRGYRVLEAASAEEALHQCRTHSGAIDLLLTDVVMPGGGGQKLAKELQSLSPQMPVIFMSGYTEDAIATHGLLGGAAFIEKPFTPGSLVQKVAEILRAR